MSIQLAYTRFQRLTHAKSKLATRRLDVREVEGTVVITRLKPNKSRRPSQTFLCAKTETGCWQVVNRRPYGRNYPKFSDGTRSFVLHRVVYEDLVGAIPQGKILMHSCDNRMCVNPAHLSPGTHYENIYDRTRKERSKHVLTISQVKEIVSLFDKYTHVEIGAMFGVDGSTISNIRTGRSWNAITGLRENPVVSRLGKKRTRIYVCKTKPELV